MRQLLVTTLSGPISHELTEDVITIGRAPDNLIQLDDPSVSGRHARFELIGEDYHLKDLASTNGTRVNGQPIQSILLRHGDRIRFGKVEASFESENATAAPPPPPVLPASDAQPAAISARPADFANASPFPGRQVQRDTFRTAAYALAALALLAFLASMLALITMRPPA